MIGKSDKPKIIGIKKVVSDINHAPYGFHVDIWAKRTDKGVELWTSECLGSESWTTYPNNPEYGCINSYFADAEWVLQRQGVWEPTTTMLIEKAVEMWLRDEVKRTVRR